MAKRKPKVLPNGNLLYTEHSQAFPCTKFTGRKTCFDVKDKKQWCANCLRLKADGY